MRKTAPGCHVITPLPRFMAGLATSVVLLLGGMSPASAEPGKAPPRDEANAAFWQRVDHLPEDPLHPPRSFYDPLVPLPGTANAPGAFLPTAVEGHTTVPALALDEAAQFVQASQGQALIVVHHGVVQLERYFGGTQADTEFSSHSFAKNLVVAAVGAAMEDGFIRSVDQPASTWLPEWRDSARAGITLRQLLTMSGGFRNTPSLDPASHYLQLHYGADIVAAVREAPVAYPPGTDFAYDNDNVVALSLVLERATGESYLSYMARRVWKPLAAGPAEMQLDRPGGRATAYCCTWAHPRDWVRFGQMLLDGGRWQGKQVLNAGFVQAMRTPSAANAHFGFQLALGAAWREPRFNRRMQAQHDGEVPSLAPDLFYMTGAGGLQLAVVPSDELVILRVGKGSPAWRDHVLPNLLVAALHPERAADVEKTWGWLYDWRLAVRPPFSAPDFQDTTQAYTWPKERVAGGAGIPLPRHADACLTSQSLAPALAEIQRVKSNSFVVWHDGAVVYEYDVDGIGSEKARERRIETASMHKSVLGLLYGQLLHEGVFTSLDAPVSNWLTEWKGDPRGEITLRHMLQMASGLAPVPFSMAAGSAYSRGLYGADNVATSLEAARAAAPGTEFNYASGVSQLLGLIVERATGQRYAQVLSTRLWQPMGASDAWVGLDHPDGHARTSSGLFATTEDWLKLGVMIVDQGRMNGRQVVDPSWIQTMSTPSAVNANYGLQLWLASPHAPRRSYNNATQAFIPAQDPFLQQDMVFFDGAGAERVYASRQARLVIVRLGPASMDWDDSRVPNLVVGALKACAAP